MAGRSPRQLCRRLVLCQSTQPRVASSTVLAGLSWAVAGGPADQLGLAVAVHALGESVAQEPPTVPLDGGARIPASRSPLRIDVNCDPALPWKRCPWTRPGSRAIAIASNTHVGAHLVGDLPADDHPQVWTTLENEAVVTHWPSSQPSSTRE